MRFAPLLALLLANCGSEPNGAVMVIDDGYRLEVVGTMADGFVSPDGLLWHEDALLMADEGGRSIRHWQADSGSVTLAGSDHGFTSPEDLVLDARGDLWFTDDNVGGLRRLGSDGRITLVAGPEQGLASTEGIALSPEGELVVGDGEAHRVFAITPEGVVRELVGPEARITKPESLAYDGHGNLYIADNEDDILYRRTPDGHVESVLRTHEGFSPESIAYSQGFLFITDSKHGRLWRYSPETGLAAVVSFGRVRQCAGRYHQPCG